jgi:hypothetical protein
MEQAGLNRPRFTTEIRNPGEWENTWQELQKLCERSASCDAAVSTDPLAPLGQHPDGPDGDSWVWWQGVRHNVLKGNVFRLIKLFWDRDSAGYDDLEMCVFLNGLPTFSQIRTECSAVGKELKRIGVGWRLATNSTDRMVTKKIREQPKKRRRNHTSKKK